MSQNFTNYAFTGSVKQAQEKYGSRATYARMEQSGDKYILGAHEADFIGSRDGFYLATVGENGWPYVQFRGGPIGFLKVLDGTTLGMVDFRGNRQYISVGNINATKKASLFLIDYPSQRRLKIWAESRVLEPQADRELLSLLSLPDYDAVVERMIVFDVVAYDWNCPQHITPRFTAEEIKQGIKTLDPDIIRSCCPDEK
ncbi:MAG: pyridoxamine 5'-phosphate oxidase family protein [Verrucomicrobia bacterium]|nr:pyridoxamine 5'-phosphate oxidase family protein [Verrucomicrobiota bacterium]